VVNWGERMAAAALKAISKEALLEVHRVCKLSLFLSFKTILKVAIDLQPH